jgi:hypothetical protein
MGELARARAAERVAAGTKELADRTAKAVGSAATATLSSVVRSVCVCVCVCVWVGGGEGRGNHIPEEERERRNTSRYCNFTFFGFGVSSVTECLKTFLSYAR